MKKIVLLLILFPSITIFSQDYGLGFGFGVSNSTSEVTYNPGLSYGLDFLYLKSSEKQIIFKAKAGYLRRESRASGFSFDGSYYIEYLHKGVNQMYFAPLLSLKTNSKYSFSVGPSINVLLLAKEKGVIYNGTRDNKEVVNDNLTDTYSPLNIDLYLDLGYKLPLKDNYAFNGELIFLRGLKNITPGNNFKSLSIRLGIIKKIN